MFKLLNTFGLYWHFVLDIILTHIFVIAFLTAGYPTIAASLMTVDSFLKILSSVFISKLVVKIPIVTRGKICLILRFIMILLWISAIIQLPFNNISIALFAPFLIFKIVLLFDTTLSTEFVFSLRELFSVDLSQSAAAQNIIVRSFTALAPAIALLLLFTPYAKMGAFILAIILYLASLPCLIKIFFAPSLSINYTKSKPSDPLTLRQMLSNKLMRWGMLFQLVGNLAFAGISFLLLSQLKPNGHLFLNEITILYTAFFIGQAGILLYGEGIIPANSTRGTAFIMFLSSLFIAAISFAHTSIIRLIFCVGIGITYSLLFSAIQKVVTTNLRGVGFVEYVGWAQTISRMAALSSTLLLGEALSNGISSSSLLILCGLMGMLGSALLASI
jgi:hypothetical protein